MKKLLTVLLLAAAVGCSTDQANKLGDKVNDKAEAEKDQLADEAKDEANEAMKMDVVDTAAKAGGFTTLVAAIHAAELQDTLKGPGPFTVFAPTDEAFKALPGGTVEELLKPENKDKLAAILKYHVVGAKVMAADVSTMEADTLLGAKAAVTKDDATGAVTFAGANVTQTDIDCTNGVIHVIDAVVMPPEGAATASAQ